MSVMDTVWGATHLKRNEVWSQQLKEIFEDQLMAQQYVNWVTEFPDGDNFKISSIGQAVIDDVTEGEALPTRRFDTGQFVFNINQFKGSKYAFTDKFFEDDFLAEQVLAATPRKMMRALDEEVEGRILNIPNAAGGQTLGGTNTINGAKHRFRAAGAANEITIADFAYAKYAFQKAKCSGAMIAIVDPSVEYTLNTLTNLVNVSNNPRFEGIVESGFGSSSMKFVKNIYGFDVYTSDYLPSLGTESLELALTATSASVSGYAPNIFMCLGDKMDMPFLGAWRRPPKLESWRDPAVETEYHQLTARYDVALYRPEALVVCASARI